MTPEQTLSVHSDEPGWGRALVASLPRSLRQVDGPAAEIGLLDGRGDWAGLARARLGQGCRKLLVIDPDCADTGVIARLAGDVEASAACCFLSERFAGNPAVAGYREWLGPEYGTVTLEGMGPDAPAAIALAQLRLLRACGLGVTDFGTVSHQPGVCLIEAEVFSGERHIHVRLSVTQSSAGPACHRMTAYAPACAARLELANGGDARPATASLFSAVHVLTLPAIHESAHRHRLRTLLAAEPGDCAEALRALARDCALASALRLDR